MKKLFTLMFLFLAVQGMGQDRFKLPISPDGFNNLTVELHDESIIEIEYAEGRTGNISIISNSNHVTFSGATIMLVADFYMEDYGVTKISYMCQSGEIWLINGHNTLPVSQDQSFDYPPKIVGIVSVFNGSPLKPGTIVLDENNPGAIRNATFAEELLFLL